MSDTAPAAPPPKQVLLRNLMPQRAILVHLLGGRAVRLGPLEVQKVDAASATSRECKRFCRDGLARIEDLPPPAVPAAKAPPAAEAATPEAPSPTLAANDSDPKEPSAPETTAAEEVEAAPKRPAAGKSAIKKDKS